MEKQKHEREVLIKAKRVSIAEHDRIATTHDANATPQQKNEKKRASYMAVRMLVQSVDYAERNGVQFDGDGI